MNVQVSDVEYARAIIFGKSLFKPKFEGNNLLSNIAEILKRIEDIKLLEKSIKKLDSVIDEYYLLWDNYITRGNFICVNVKRYNDIIDIEEILSNWNTELSNEQKNAIREYFTDEDINEIWWDWLEFNTELVMDAYNGSVVISNSFYDDLIKDIKQDRKTPYEEVNKLRTKEKKIALVEKYREDNNEIKQHIDYLSNFECAFCGNNGGYFGIAPPNNVYDLLDTLSFEYNDYVNFIEEVPSIEISQIDNGYIHNAIEKIDYAIEEINNVISAVEWFLNWIDDFNKGLDFKEEIIFRIEEYLEREFT